MKRLLIHAVVLLIAISLLGSLTGAQSTYVEPPAAPDEEAYNISEVDQLQLYIGQTLILTAFPEPEGTDLVWVSSITAVATVQGLSPMARVTAVAPGTTKITARALTAQEDGTYWEESVTVEVLSTPTPPTGGTASFNLILYSLLTMAAVPVVYKRLKK